MAQLDPDGPRAMAGERVEVADEPRGGEVRELLAGYASGVHRGEEQPHLPDLLAQLAHRALGLECEVAARFRNASRRSRELRAR